MNYREVIINFDADKLFDSENDFKNLNENKREYIIHTIKSLQAELKSKKRKEWSTSKAFTLCGLYLTNTPNEALVAS